MSEREFFIRFRLIARKLARSLGISQVAMLKALAELSKQEVEILINEQKQAA